MEFDFYPSAKDLIESELSVLNHLRTDTYITENHSHLADAANKYYARSRASYAGGFEFFSYFDMWHRPAHKGKLKLLNPWLSEPRLFSSPMSLALLVDMAFHEFPDQPSGKFRNTSAWKELI